MKNDQTGHDARFAVLAQAKDGDPLFLIDLTFARLIDDLVKPYEENEPFFIDGVPLTRDKLIRLKIVKQDQYFIDIFQQFHGQLRVSDDKTKKILGDQYEIRLQAILREAGEDVTSQIVKAYSAKIKPSIKDYLPKRDQLIEAAMTIFVESIKALNKG